jgi:hypothetical protein
MCHLWKCWYHVSWNLLYPLSIFRVILSLLSNKREKWLLFHFPYHWTGLRHVSDCLLSTSINDSLFVIQYSCFVDYLYIYLQGSRLRTIQAKKSPCGGWFGFLIRQRRSSSCLVILKSRLHRITERHPLPWSNFTDTNLSFHLFITLVCVCWY